MWDNVLGHQQNKEFLQRFLASPARPHALLFCGEEGLGKRLLAMEFAKTLLCFNQQGNDDCESCRLLNFADDSLANPDFILLEPPEDSKNIKIEQIKELIRQSAFGPVLSKNKVCIVDKADKMTVDAANSFLKLLEEPPEGWVIILLANSDSFILPTILSRVIKIKFSPLQNAEIEKVLVRKNIVPAEAAVLARISEGSVGTALKLQQQNFWEYRKQAVALLEYLPLAKPFGYLSGKPWLEYNFDEAILFVKQLQLLLRDMLFIKLGMQESIYNCDLREALADLQFSWQIKQLKAALDEVLQAYTAIVSNAGRKMVLEAMALKIDKIRKE